MADEFDRHVSLSVPDYERVQHLVARLSTYFATPGGVHVDWGCSTGRTIFEVARANPGRGLRHVGVDDSAQMLTRAHQRLREAGIPAELRLLPVERAHVPDGTCLVTSLYTLQFLPPDRRREALSAAAAGLREGGALLLVEKVVPDDPELCAPFQDLLWDEKLANGYSETEVAGKARSLRGVLRPLRASAVERAVAEAGFRATRFWQCLSFVGWCCVRGPE